MKTGWAFGGLVVVATISMGAGCGSSKSAPDTTAPVDDYIHYDVPAVTVAPAQNAMWLQWIAAPFDHDLNVVDLVATQQQGGHHALLYATTNMQPVGTTRPFLNADQLDIQFIGGVGGEGGQPVKLPDGVYFRLPAGKSLAVQTHYVNASSEPIEGKTSIAIKFAVPADGDKLASMFVNTSTKVNVAPLANTQQDVACPMQKDVPLVMYANHMHEMGSSITTTVARDNAAPTVFKTNPQWSSEWTYNPDYSYATAAAPTVLTAGTSLTTHCEWHNTSDRTLAMPDEMCLFIGFFLGTKDITCVDGKWAE